MIIKIFSSYVETLLKDINNPALLQEWKLNIEAAAHENKLMLTCFKIMIKKKLIVMISTCTGKTQ